MGAKLKIIISMTIFGTIGIFVKNIMLSSSEIALHRAIIATIVIFMYKLMVKKKIVLQDIKRKLPILFISGAVMGLNWILLFQAYKYTTLSIATLCYCFALVIVMIGSPILFKEKLTLKQIMCFVMATIGLVMIFGVSGMEKSSNNLLGICFGLGAAVCYATVVLLNKHVKSINGIDKTLIQFLAVIVVLAPYVMVTTGLEIGNLDILGILNLLIIGVLHTGISYCMYFSSIEDLKGQEVSILSYVDPTVAIIISVTILGEPMNIMQIIGGAMILGFTLLNELGQKDKLSQGMVL